MIGTWRLTLALMVVSAHLFKPWWPGAFAVFSFYVISGFLMTLILNEQYSFSWAGLRVFWLNRVLRIFPPYYFACLVSLLLIAVYSQSSVKALNSHITVPNSLYEIMNNLFIFGLRDWPEDKSSLIPPGWTLYIELVYYLVISLWAGRSKLNAWIFLTIGASYVAYVYIFEDGGFVQRYFFVKAGALPFAMGAVLYFYLDKVKNIINRVTWMKAFSASLLAYVGLFVLSSFVENPLGSLLYANIVITALLLAVLWHAPPMSIKNVDKWLGDKSYPVYLLHWQAGIAVMLVTGYSVGDIRLFLTTIALVLVFAVVENKLVSEPIDKLRKNNKNRMSKKLDINIKNSDVLMVNEPVVKT